MKKILGILTIVLSLSTLSANAQVGGGGQMDLSHRTL